jgi:membrane-associated phospholipid phosphatase
MFLVRMKQSIAVLKRIGASIALFSIELLAIWAIFLGSVIVFLFVSKEIFYNKQESFDQRIFEKVHTWVSPEFTSFMKSVTFLASWEFILSLSFVILIYFLFIKKHHWYSLKIPVVAIGSISLNVLLKNIFGRPRPFLPHLVEASGLSYPSGHAMISFSFYGLLIYLAWVEIQNKTVRWIVCLSLLILIHLIGFSRVYLRVHYASDVLAGFALGTVWLIISIYLLKRIEKYSAEKVKNVPHIAKAE